MRRERLFGWLATGLLLGMAAACSINPQPLPPDQPGGDAGFANVGSGDTGDEPGSEDASVASDAGNVLLSGDASTADGGLVGSPSGDGGDAGDAAEDGGDGGNDAGNAGNAGDAGDAGDASEDGGETSDSGDAG